MAVNELPNGDVNKAARLHRGRGDGRVCVRDRVQVFEVLFFSTRFTAD
jgi:hypothetical protein